MTSRRIRSTTALLTAVVLAAACTPSDPGAPMPGSGGPAAGVTEAFAATAIAAPTKTGSGSVGSTLPADMSPTRAPAQAGDLAGTALPTNQWWSSALTGPRTQPIWAHPLAVQAAESGVQVSSAPVTATANGIVTPFVAALTAGGATGDVSVVSYGAFHVVVRAALTGGGSVDATIVQGSPVLYLSFDKAKPTLTTTGAVRDLGTTDRISRLDVAGQRWDVVGSGLELAGSSLTGSGKQLAVARVPDGVDAAAWEKAITAAPVTATTAAMAYDTTRGTVTQTLTVERSSGDAGVFALLPHQRTGLVAGATPLAGSYPDARGPLSLVQANSVQVAVAMPGLLPGVPKVALTRKATAAVVAGLDADLADPPGAGGSYFGLKELGRLATIAEVAGAVGAGRQRDAALAKLKPQLIDWLTYSGPSDGRYFAYDKVWGGLIAVPAEFGSQDYNDHHFQFAYLVRAAAVMAAAEPAFGKDYGPVVDLVVRDFAGSLAVPDADGGFPPFRAFNAYLGSSAASGFAPFADGNNQESSGEAVAAWEAVTRWGIARDNQDLITYGATHYATEAATARMYWLGEGLQRPTGYAHTTAGIVWDAKVDYATWFDPKPESIIGIQLLPLTFGSLYRASSSAARATELEKAVGGKPRVWGDLFAADLAGSDPAAARKRLEAGVPREESTSRGLVRYWVESLAVLGPPQPGVVAAGPYGLAFGAVDEPKLLTAGTDVAFHRDGKKVG